MEIDANDLINRQSQRIGELQTDILIRDSRIEDLQNQLAEAERALEQADGHHT